MKTTLKKLKKSQVQLTIELSDAEWKKYFQQAVKKLSAQVNIPGFRKGHIPEQVLLENIGEEAIFSETLELAVPQAYMDAVKKEGIQPIAQPEVNVAKPQPFTFEVTVPVMPEVTVKELTGFKPDTKTPTASKKEVDEMVEYFQKQVAEKKEVTRKAKKGDIVTIDFAGFDMDGVGLDGTQSKGHSLEIGSETMIPGFEEELIGLKPTEKKSFEIAFPKDYHAKSFAGKKVRFDVTVHKVEETILPEVNEDFVEKITGKKKPVAELRKEIEDSLKERKKEEKRRENEKKLLELVQKKTEGEIPDVLIDDEVDYLIDNLKMQGLQQGLTWENQLMHLKKSETELKKDFRSQAEDQVRMRLGVQKFLEKDAVSASDEDIQKEVNYTLSRLNEKQRAQQKSLFQKGARGWQEAENRVRVSKWIEEKIEKK